MRAEASAILLQEVLLTVPVGDVHGVATTAVVGVLHGVALTMLKEPDTGHARPLQGELPSKPSCIVSGVAEHSLKSSIVGAA